MNFLSIIWKRRDTRWLASLLMGTVGSLAALVVIIRWAGMEDVWRHLWSVDFVYLVLYFQLAMAIYLVRAWRFQLLLGGKVHLTALYGVVSVHTLMINLLPASTGEISYPFLLKHYGISHRFTDGVPSIVAARFQDLVVTTSLMLGALIWAGDFNIIVQIMRGWSTAVIAAGVIIGFGLIVTQRFVNKIFISFGRFLKEVLVSLRNLSLGIWCLSFLLAIISRLVSIIAVYCLIRGAHVSLPLPTVILVSSLYVFLPLLPVNTLAGLGISEGILALFFVGSGMQKHLATAAGIQIHLLQLFIAGFLGVIGIVLLQYKRGPAMVSSQGVLLRR
jgi:glycosyltransferase 2 family protein